MLDHGIHHGEDEANDVSTLHTSEATNLLEDIPGEIFLHIASFLDDIADILALRMTCSATYQLTHDKALFLSFLRFQKRFLPLPPSCTDEAIVALSLQEVERLVVSAHRIDRTWLLPRPPPLSPNLLPKFSIERGFHGADGGGAKTILGMEVFLERWLLCVYQERLVELWDLHPEGILPGSSETDANGHIQTVCCMSAQLKGAGPYSSSSTCLNDDNDSLILAVTSNEGCLFLRIQLPIPSVNGTAVEAGIEIIVVLPMPTPMLLVRALYPPGNLAIISHSNSFILLNWGTSERWEVDTSNPDEEELWNGIIGAKFLSARHILCIKVHCIELCTLPALPSRSKTTQRDTIQQEARIRAHVVTYTLPRTTFRGGSFSAPHTLSQPDPSPTEWSTTRMSISFLAFDIIRGLFHYRVSVDLPCPPMSPPPSCISKEAPAPPHMAVYLVAAHHMAVPAGASASSHSGSMRVPRSGLTPGSRGFVTSCVLGQTGRRGVWVERRRGSVRRGIVGFATARDALEEDGLNERATNGTQQAGQIGAAGGTDERDSDPNWWENGVEPGIDGRTVYEINSYDLRDDITHCAFAEATGRIVLGTRNGRIQVLR